MASVNQKFIDDYNRIIDPLDNKVDFGLINGIASYIIKTPEIQATYTIKEEVNTKLRDIRKKDSTLAEKVKTLLAQITTLNTQLAAAAKAKTKAKTPAAAAAGTPAGAAAGTAAGPPAAPLLPPPPPGAATIAAYNALSNDELLRNLTFDGIYKITNTPSTGGNYFHRLTGHDVTRRNNENNRNLTEYEYTPPTPHSPLPINNVEFTSHINSNGILNQQKVQHSLNGLLVLRYIPNTEPKWCVLDENLTFPTDFIPTNLIDGTSKRVQQEHIENIYKDVWGPNFDDYTLKIVSKRLHVLSGICPVSRLYALGIVVLGTYINNALNYSSSYDMSFEINIKDKLIDDKNYINKFISTRYTFGLDKETVNNNTTHSLKLCTPLLPRQIYSNIHTGPTITLFDKNVYTFRHILHKLCFQLLGYPIFPDTSCSTIEIKDVHKKLNYDCEVTAVLNYTPTILMEAPRIQKFLKENIPRSRNKTCKHILGYNTPALENTSNTITQHTKHHKYEESSETGFTNLSIKEKKEYVNVLLQCTDKEKVLTPTPVLYPDPPVKLTWILHESKTNINANTNPTQSVIEYFNKNISEIRIPNMNTYIHPGGRLVCTGLCDAEYILYEKWLKHENMYNYIRSGIYFVPLLPSIPRIKGNIQHNVNEMYFPRKITTFNNFLFRYITQFYKMLSDYASKSKGLEFNNTCEQAQNNIHFSNNDASCVFIHKVRLNFVKLLSEKVLKEKPRPPLYAGYTNAKTTFDILSSINLSERTPSVQNRDGLYKDEIKVLIDLLTEFGGTVDLNMKCTSSIKRRDESYDAVCLGVDKI